jgi:hypothetical protein
MDYHHTQYNRWLIAGAALGLAVLVYLAFITNFNPVFGIAIGFPAAFLIIFHSLTVHVNSQVVALRFGWGWPRRVISITEIRDVCIVESPPEHGWGIRAIPSGALYRIAGRTAVELQLTEGRVVRIGTDQPDELARAVEKALIWQKSKK